MAEPTVLILTPVKQAAEHATTYFDALAGLDYPPDRLSIGMLEGDSADGTFDLFAEKLAGLEPTLRRVTMTRWESGFRLPRGAPRWAPPVQLPRRVVLARARNGSCTRRSTTRSGCCGSTST